MAKEKESNAMFWGVVLGAIGGAAFTLLRTPRSGREIRGEITSQASRLTSRGQPPASYTWQPPCPASQPRSAAGGRCRRGRSADRPARLRLPLPHSRSRWPATGQGCPAAGLGGRC